MKGRAGSIARNGPGAGASTRHSAASRSRPQAGFALLIVLLTVGFLALLGTQLVAIGRGETRLAGNMTQAAGLEAAAQGAIAHAVFALMVERDAAFRPGPQTRTVRIGAIPVQLAIRNENDRVNPNICSLALMQALLIEVGASPDRAAHLAAAILDWRTNGDQPRPNGAKTAQYLAAGLRYGPPQAPFMSVDELRLVLGMTPDLFDRLAPHLTVLTDSDPDLSTQDPVVARALTDAAGVAQDAMTLPISDNNLMLHITATAIGPGAARYSVTEVVTTAFHDADPRPHILLRERCLPPLGPHTASACA